MRRTLHYALAVASLAGLLWAAPGCSSQEGMSERREQAHKEMVADLAADTETDATAGKDVVEGSGPAAPGEASGDELAPLRSLEEPGADTETTSPATSPAKTASAAPMSRNGAGQGAASKAPIGAAGAGSPQPSSPADQVLNDMRQDEAFRKQEARYHAKMGDGYFQQARYPEAVKSYRRALDLDPLMDGVRARYNDALTLLNERSGQVASFSNEIHDMAEVARQQREAEIQKYMEGARKALEKKDMAEAESLAGKAVDAVNFDQDVNSDLRKEAKDLLTKVRNEKRRYEADLQAQLIQSARKQAEEDLKEEEKIRNRQVQTLLRKSMDLLRLQDYEKAVEVCERVLELDPGNLVAKFWISDAREQLVKLRRYKLVESRLENKKLAQEAFAEASIPYTTVFVFPEEDAWKRAQARSQELSAISTEDPEWIRRIKRRLEGTKVGFSFDETPLQDAVQQLRTFTGVAIMVDPQVDAEGKTISMNIQDVTAFNALNLILDNAGLTYTFKENVLFVTTPGQGGGRTELAIYNVSDLLNKIRDFEGPELMLKPQGDQGNAPVSFEGGLSEDEDEIDPETLKTHVIESTGGDDVWQDPNSIETHSGQFLVTAPRELHAKVQSVLANLRKDADLFVVIEARFIDVNDDFLEDIGIDARALGVVNNLGVPFGNVINTNATGGQDLGFTQTGNPLTDVALVMGQDRWAGRIQHIIDGFTGVIRGDNLTAGGGTGGLTLQATWLEPFQLNVILRAVQERANVRQLTAPVVTAHNGQRVYVSVITQRAYIADYNLVSGGTGFSIIEVADPEVQTFQEGVILDVDPIVSYDKKYVTLDVKPTLASLIGGVISTILISLGSFTNVAFQVPIGVPQISLQQTFTSVTVPNGGTVLLGGFKSLNEAKYKSYLPLLGSIPLLNNVFRRKAQLSEKRSLVILVTARIVDLQGEEAEKFNPE